MTHQSSSSVLLQFYRSGLRARRHVYEAKIIDNTVMHQSSSVVSLESACWRTYSDEAAYWNSIVLVYRRAGKATTESRWVTLRSSRHGKADGNVPSRA